MKDHLEVVYQIRNKDQTFDIEKLKRLDTLTLHGVIDCDTQHNIF